MRSSFVLGRGKATSLAASCLCPMGTSAPAGPSHSPFPGQRPLKAHYEFVYPGIPTPARTGPLTSTLRLAQTSSGNEKLCDPFCPGG